MKQMTTEQSTTSSVIDAPLTPAQEAPAALPERGDLRSRGYSRSQARAEVAQAAQAAKDAPRSAFTPLLLGGLAMLGWLAFQAQQLYVERQILQSAYASQQQTVDNAAKLRASLDALAADTQRLADAGNPNARALVDELKKRGVTINSANTPPANAAPAVR